MDLDWTDWNPAKESDGDRGEDMTTIGACADVYGADVYGVSDDSEWSCLVWRHTQRGWIAAIWGHAGAGSDEPREECVDSLDHGKAVCEREWFRELLERVRAVLSCS